MSPVAVNYNSDIVPVPSKEVLDIQATLEYRFTLKRVRDMIRTYIEMNGVRKTLHFSIINLGKNCHNPFSSYIHMYIDT